MSCRDERLCHRIDAQSLTWSFQVAAIWSIKGTHSQLRHYFFFSMCTQSQQTKRVREVTAAAAAELECHFITNLPAFGHWRIKFPSFRTTVVCDLLAHSDGEMVTGWVGVGGWCAGASMSWHCSCCNTAPQTPPMSTTRTDSDITKVLLTHWHCCSVSPSLQLNFVSVCECILAGIISRYSYSISSCSPFLFSYLLCFVPALSSWC